MASRKNERKNKKKSKWKNRIINFFLLLLLLIGLALIFNVQIRYFLMSLNGGKYDTKHFTVEQIQKNKKKKATFDYKKVEPVSTEAVLFAQFNTADLPTIGEIVIPELDIRLPIFKGVSNTALLYGAGTLKEDQEMGKGNYALASHRVDDPTLLFSPLQRAENGQLVYLTDLQKIYEYKIFSVERVTPDHSEVLDDVPGKKLVTLVTCNDPGAVMRVIVQGELTDEKDVANATHAMREAMKEHINQGYW
ncbi:sortase A [Pilibacter termitis]|uniref:Sortase A n=1 Tax=Pilibacter termitis TaxID=263852 RepID=A0A1T4Q1L3_9ENTE|nr:class A sortase [Pilibacter termitis]SJZ97720.1 sortase A [Pilibacter termitis]